MVIRALILCGLLALASCVSSGGTFCDVASPLRLSPEVIAEMSEKEVADALALNRKGAKLCGWRP